MAEGPSDLEEFDSYSQPRSILKSAISFKDMVEGKACKFEINQDSCFDVYGDSDSDDEDSFHRKNLPMFLDPQYQTQPIDPNMIRLDEPIEDYDELEADMVSIHEGATIKKKVVKEGNGVPVPADAKVFISYVGFAEGRKEPFDKICEGSYKRCTAVYLGGDELVYGLRVGLRTMSIGEISKILIHPEMGFGKMGCPPRIPANARIVFTVEIHRFVPSEKFSDIFFMSAEDRAKVPFAEIIKVVKNCKATGNRKYYDRDYYGALKLYSRGIVLLADYPTSNDTENAERDSEVSILFSNKAQCLIKLNSPKRACVACKGGLRFCDQRSRPKLLVRFAEAKYMLEAYDDALKYITEGLKLFRAQKINNQNHADLLAKIVKGIKDSQEMEKYLCKKMLSSASVSKPQTSAAAKLNPN